MELLEYEDSLVAMNSIFEQYGVRQCLIDFRGSYPAMYEELVVQIQRLKPEKQVAVLLRK